MTRVKITAPVAGFSGDVVGVTFTGGVGRTDDPRLLAYFRRHGYMLEPESKPAPVKRATRTK